jgi:hypothetical protein
MKIQKSLDKLKDILSADRQGQEISSSLKVISMQRKKGLRVLRELKEEQKRNK